MRLAGKNFETGFLVRSVNTPIRKEEEHVHWWEFHGIRSVN
jgi:hypothetical protein